MSRGLGDVYKRQLERDVAARGSECARGFERVDRLAVAREPDRALALQEREVGVARRLAVEGRCEAALPELARARGSECARSDVALQLAVARYHQGDLAGAETALREAEALGEQGAEVELYRGFLLLQRAEEPAAALERARALGGNAVEPVASYYAGIALAAADDRAAAREALERVVAEWPGTEWAREAERTLAKLEGGAPRRWLSLRAGYEYDDNVALLGNGVALPSQISSQRDDRAAWLLQAGGELFRSGRWSAGAAVSYEGWLQADLSQFDLHYPSLVTWLDRDIREGTTARVALDADYAWVDNEPFYTSQGVGFVVFQRVGRFGTAEVGARYWRQNYLFPNDDVPDGPGDPGAPCLDDDDPFCGPPGIDEGRARNQDGDGFTVGVLHTFPMLWEMAQFRAGYRYHHFGARGSEYSYNAHELLGDVIVKLPAGFELRLAGRWADQPFRHFSTFPDPDDVQPGVEYPLSRSRRDESFLETEVAIARPITRYLTLSAAWRYQRSRSNVDVFDYRRNVLGVYATVGL